MRLILALVFLLLLNSFAFSQKLEEPVFIAAVSCEFNLDEKIKAVNKAYFEENYSKTYKDKKIAELAREINETIFCESRFSNYDIRPLTWMHPRKLMLVIKSMENSYLFKSTKVTMVKANEKNHIFLKASFEPNEPKHHIEVNYSLFQEKGMDNESDRKTQAWDLHYKFGFMNRKIAPLFDIYIKRNLSTSDDIVALEREELDELTETQKVSLEKNNHSYGEFSFLTTVPKVWRNADISLGLTLNANKLPGDDAPARSSKTRLGFNFHNSTRYLLKSSDFEVYFESISRELPTSQSVIKDESDDDRRVNRVDHEDYYIGFNLTTKVEQWEQASIDYRRLFDNDVRYYYNVSLYWPIKTFTYGHISLGGSVEKNHNYSGLERRFILPYYTMGSIFLGAAFDLNLEGTKQSLQVMYGNRDIRSHENEELDGYRRSSNYIEANYIVHHDHFTTKLGFLAGERLY